ncbi:MAG: DMT family transporter [Actinomycetota bacterium]|nr:DMT family transporter [Actinomycetota bacterium]
MLAIALALGASLSWGLGDFLGGLKSRTLHVLTVLVLSQVVGLAAALVWVIASGDGTPGWAATAFAAAAGASGCLGIATLYRGMAIGAMGIVAPISATAAVIPFAVGIGSGERPGVLQIAGILLALGGVGLASREPTERGGRRADGIGLALLAALGFGLYFVFADLAADESVPFAVATARGVSLLLALVALLVVGVTLRTGRANLPALAAVGLCDVSANVLFSLATTRGFLSVVSVLSALYPVVTVALAALVLHERVARTQRLGVGAALVGAALITAG